MTLYVPATNDHPVDLRTLDFSTLLGTVICGAHADFPRADASTDRLTTTTPPPPLGGTILVREVTFLPAVAAGTYPPERGAIQPFGLAVFLVIGVTLLWWGRGYQYHRSKGQLHAGTAPIARRRIAPTCRLTP